MPETSTQVLTHQQVSDKITRMAWQLYEEFQEAEEVYLVGIAERGFMLAGYLQKELESISDIKAKVLKLKLNKKEPLDKAIALEPSEQNFSQQNIVVIDDVLNSGSTLIYGVNYFLQYDVKSLKTAVLVDRNHKRYPVKADYKGLSLSTSLQEHVTVHFDENNYSVEVS